MAPISRVVVAGHGSVADAVTALIRRTGVEIVPAANPLAALDLGEAGADLAVECLASGSQLKRAAVEALDTVLPLDAPLLTLGWTVTATEAATWCKRGQRLLGFSLIPPVGETGSVVEVALPLQVGAAREAETALARVSEFWQHLGCGVERVNDQPGFVLPRILFLVINEAAYALMEGVATAEAIDTAMRLGANYARGPLAWADLIGLDRVAATLEFLHRELGDDRYRVCPLLRQLVRAGRTGRQADRGFYEYRS